VTYGYVALQRLQSGLIENLGNQTHVLEYNDLVAICGGDSSRFLASVLQSIESKESQLGNLFAFGPNSEYAALILRALFARQKVVI
jgi:hypothetical protein